MKYNKFIIKILLRVFGITLTSFLFIWALVYDHLVFTRFAIALTLVVQTYLLFRYVSVTNRNLNNFLLSLRYLDSVNVSDLKDASFNELNLTFNQIIDIVKKAQIDKATQSHYFQYTVEHVGVGLLSYSENGEIDIFNQAAQDIFKIPRPESISQLAETLPDLTHNIQDLATNEPVLITVIIQGELLKLSTKATEFVLQGVKKKLISFQNIQPELASGELDAWQKLIRVLTHEIMNSITPIKSLVGTILRMFERDGEDIVPSDLKPATVSSARVGLKTIKKQSKRLIEFVSSYRSLTKLPAPNFATITIKDLIEELELLMNEQIKSSGITFQINCQPTKLKCIMDEKLILQVLINLVKNSIQAMSEIDDPAIQLAAYMDESGKTIISVSDNGSGIDQDVMDQIFVPFFTTKADGWGIGLSLSRQIMMMHKGTLQASSDSQGRTVFSLRF